MKEQPDPRQRLLAAIAAAYAPLGATLADETLIFPDRELSLHGLPQFLQLVTDSTEFTRLPPLFGADQGLPMASMYVELAISQSRAQPAPTLLASPDSLPAALEAHQRQLQAQRVSVDDALGSGQHGHVVILGDPGSGKTSLLKRAAAMIAAGQWPGWIVPLYIPLRRYWETRHRYPDTDMTPLRFAAARIVEMHHFGFRRELVSTVSVLPHMSAPLQQEIDEVCSLLTYLSGPQRQHVLFLLDGLDEIASDQEAITVLTEDIRQLGHGFAWVLTSRRTGFFGGLEESIRFEVVSLDNGGMEQLVRNWFKHQADETIRHAGAERVLAQIMDNPRLLSMARNPFLLTLLCHLHADGALPLYRSQVYERIFKLARQQLCQREKDPRLFGSGEIAFLTDFCHHLYTDAPRAPRHLFDRDDWQRFAAPALAPDLERHYLKSRLLNQWGEVGDYHLVHLTLHEYLVARALAAPQVPVQKALAHIHQPHWRMVLRFLAGCYQDENRTADLARLLKAMLTPVDINGLMYLEAAQLLLEARIEDSRSLLGVDLRDTLWQLWCEDAPLLADVAGQALATLAPALALDRVQALLDAVTGAFKIGSQASEQDVAGNRAMRAIRLLADVQTDAATTLLIRLLLDEQRPQLANAAIEALAKRNWPAVRRAVLDAAATLPVQGATFVRICHLAGFTRHRDFAPWLLAHLASATPPAADLAVACALVGGPGLDVALLHRVQADPAITAMWSSAIWDGVASTCADWRDWISKLAQAPDAGCPPMLASAVAATAIRLRLLDADAILALFHAADDDEEALSALVEAIGDGALANRATADLLERALLAWLPRADVRRAAVFSLSILDEQRIGRGMPARHTSSFIPLLQDEDDEVRELALDALGVARERSVLQAVLALSGDESQHISVRVAAIHSLIHLAADGAQHIVSHLVGLLDDALPELVLEAALALARIAPVKLGPHLASPVIRRALAQVGADQGMVFFDDFFIDASGTRHEWEGKPAQVAVPAPVPAPLSTPAPAQVQAANGPVFISFNSLDEAIVGELVAQLKAAGVAVLWDREHLPRQGRWQAELYAMIQRAGSALIFCGAHGPGQWQEEEIDTCLQRTKQDKGFALRAVWLPGVVPQAFAGFLDNYDRIDLRTGVRIEALLARLLRGGAASLVANITGPQFDVAMQADQPMPAGHIPGQLQALDSFLPSPTPLAADVLAATLQQDHLNRRLADPKVRARWSLDDLAAEEYDALRLIHSACICRRVDYLAALWPGRAWSALAHKLVERGVLLEDDFNLVTEQHVAAHLVQDRQAILATHEQWIARLTPLGGHWDLAIELGTHLAATRRYAELAQLLHTHMHSVEEAWVQDIFGQFAHAMDGKPRIMRHLAPHERILVLDAIGVYRLNRGETDIALDAFCRMGKIAARANDEWGLGQSWLHRGMVWFTRQDIEQAARCYQRAVEQARSSGDDFLLGRALHNQAQCLLESSPTDAARLLEESAACKERSGDKEGLFATYDGLAHLARVRGDMKEAARGFRRAVTLARRTGWRSHLAHGLANLASCLCELGEHGESRQLGEEAYAIAHDLKDKRLLILSTSSLAVCCHQAGDNERAKPLFAEYAELMQQSGDYNEAVLALSNLGAVCIKLGDAQGARKILDQALSIARQHRALEHVPDVLTNYAASWFELDQQAAWLAWLAQAGQDAAGRGEWAIVAELCEIEAQQREAWGEAVETIKLLWDRAVAAISNSQDWPRRIELMMQRYGWLRDHLGRAAALPAIEELVTTLRHRKQLRREYATALIELGDAQQELGQYPQAEKTYQRALAVLKVIPDTELTANLLHNYAELLRKTEQFLPAIAIYTSLLDLTPETDWEQRYFIEHSMALAEAGSGEIAKAEARLKRIRDLSGKRQYWEAHTRAWLALGDLANQAESHRLALQRYDKTVSFAIAHELDDWHLLAELQRAELLLALGRAGEVVAALAPICTKFNRHPDAVELYRALAEGYSRCGQADVAELLLRQALDRIGAADPRYMKMREVLEQISTPVT